MYIIHPIYLEQFHTSIFYNDSYKAKLNFYLFTFYYCHYRQWGCNINYLNEVFLFILVMTHIHNIRSSIWKHMYVWWLHLLYKRLAVLNPFVHKKFLIHCITSVVINGLHTILSLLSTCDNYWHSFKMIIVTSNVTKLLQYWILQFAELNILSYSDVSPMHLIIIIWKLLQQITIEAFPT